MPDIDQRKSRLRQKLRERRRIAAEANGAAIAELAAQIFTAAIPLSAGLVIAGYWPLPDELDPRPLLDRLRTEFSARILLPVVDAPARPLRFRLWQQGAPLHPDRFGIPGPGPEAPELRPDILIVPLVGFDAAGGRLGLGGGFYDATLAGLRADASAALLAVGYAFAVQQVPGVPVGAMDQRLDWVVTERRAIRCGEARRM